MGLNNVPKTLMVKNVFKIYKKSCLNSNYLFKKASTFFLFGFILPATNAIMIATIENKNSPTDHLKTSVKTNIIIAEINMTPSLGPNFKYE
jgi:hypothetical protein